MTPCLSGINSTHGLICQGLTEVFMNWPATVTSLTSNLKNKAKFVTIKITFVFEIGLESLFHNLKTATQEK